MEKTRAICKEGAENGPTKTSLLDSLFFIPSPTQSLYTLEVCFSKE